jgi:hypothetical protein
MEGPLPPVTTAEQVYASAVRELHQPLVEALEEVSESEDAGWAEALLRAVPPIYRRYLASWSAPSVRWEVIAPLAHFEADLDTQNAGIQITDHLWLIPLTAEAKSELWDSRARSGADLMIPPPMDIARDGSETLMG